MSVSPIECISLQKLTHPALKLGTQTFQFKWAYVLWLLLTAVLVFLMAGCSSRPPTHANAQRQYLWAKHQKRMFQQQRTQNLPQVQYLVCGNGTHRCAGLTHIHSQEVTS